MNDGIIKNRIKAIRRRLNKKNINCLILTKPANITYTTGFSGSDSWAAITPAGVYLLTDSRYTEQAQNQCPSCRIIHRSGPMVEAVSKLIEKLRSVQTVAVEKSTTIAAFEALKKQVKKARLKTIANIIEQLRSSKDAAEIAAIRAAAQIATQALKQTLTIIKPGITENELAGVLDFQIRRLGAVNSFDTIAAFGPNASHPHHQPGTRKLKKNDCILIDFGVRYKNYCCDLTRCFAVGRPTLFYRKVYNAVQEAQAAALKMVKPGVKIRQVDAAARNVLAGYGLPVYGHGTGHGLGLEVHEEPIITANSESRLEAGMVLTIEPAVYIPGKLGVRIEDDILVTETGCQILSRNCPKIPQYTTTL
ncbi:MAG TPA: aminopeptidase P family protein [Phycisphaerales bacterium]|nr:aminopeptidase P family protein [Phycisphaerales bacterium]